MPKQQAAPLTGFNLPENILNTTCIEDETGLVLFHDCELIELRSNAAFVQVEGRKIFRGAEASNHPMPPLHQVRNDLKRLPDAASGLGDSLQGRRHLQ